MENQEKILNSIILALQDNKKDKNRAIKENDYEEEAYCNGYESALCFVLSHYGISYDEAINKKISKKKV